MSLDVPEPSPQPSEMPYDPNAPTSPETPVQQPYDVGTEENQQPGP